MDLGLVFAIVYRMLEIKSCSYLVSCFVIRVLAVGNLRAQLNIKQISLDVKGNFTNFLGTLEIFLDVRSV